MVVLFLGVSSNGVLIVIGRNSHARRTRTGNYT